MTNELSNVNELLKQQALEIVKGGKDAAGKAVEFLQGQLPDVVQQLLLWNFWLNFIEFLVAIAWAIIIISFAYKFIKKFLKDGDDGAVPGVMIFAAFFLFPAGFFINLQWLQIWLAPKVWLIEYMIKLVK